ncbi:16S rRNA (adenine(1518)-N(6)/adenine(1519)-N(6))-dimethyltransferase RsmA [Zeaxanthinibacter sp. PT1]|uniref:16S rRNA (adenine(1518)-N(6)/adenine(1519)-N(6))- dimethyltransferase RsmA n=1 Tax=Zeaxanthinibacter TaxID=561554 RepID=UPI00234C0170|nr:16S rRNA (adenine(1518)-N(6)/adenine(1519)-N(6))-dimethyltransferase RsmA [Zeaxanthinibacter sp. PT1]MDC6350312.1 16S rRNA (adenine(1518)-N(6)/adenine(1519)-N(6))-dimethyltransferase RsmA [Zeaxanthinibacter sp. PT1]
MAAKGKNKKSPKRFKTYKNKEPQSPVKAKKYLGQHFLKDEEIAGKIAHTLELEGYNNVLEIGPGTGVMTKYLLDRDVALVAMDIDEESIVYLNHSFPLEHPNLLAGGKDFRVIQADFLNYDLSQLFGQEPFGITGNFPYNISTQIVFKLLEWRDQVPEFSGMFQKEVAERICEKEGSKTYGILSVLVQAFYEASYLFTVHPEVFDPPPKIQSGVLRLVRKDNEALDCDEKLFFRVVKTAFNQRRKTLRNSLKVFELSDNLKEDIIFDRRPEQLSVAEFIALTNKIANDTL